jgi:hypothetical protein
MVSRRGFWRGLLQETLSFHEEVKGITQCFLDDIGNLPDAVAAEIIPVWMNGREPDIRPNGIYQTGKDGKTVCVLALTAREQAMLAQYNGGRNLNAISQCIALEFGLAADKAFASTRDLFTQLCLAGFCHPAAAHNIEDRGTSKNRTTGD